MSTLAEMRAEAAKQSRQLEAVLWLTVADLAARWGVSTGTVRKIPRTELPYLTLGASHVRRYNPDDVQGFEAKAKRGDAA